MLILGGPSFELLIFRNTDYSTDDSFSAFRAKWKSDSSVSFLSPFSLPNGPDI